MLKLSISPERECSERECVSEKSAQREGAWEESSASLLDCALRVPILPFNWLKISSSISHFEPGEAREKSQRSARVRGRKATLHFWAPGYEPHGIQILV